MIIKVILFLFSLLFLCILIIASSTEKMEVLYYQYKNDGLLQSQKYIYGDLYGLAYLPKFKLQEPIRPRTVPFNKNPSTKIVNLFLVKDSYLGKDFITNDSLFSHLNSYHDTQWGMESVFFDLKSDTRNINILLFETVERYFLQRFSDTSVVLKKAMSRKNIIRPSKFLDQIFNKQIEANLENCLFDYAFCNLFKELKATAIYNLFDRLNAKVEISNDKDYLLLTETTDNTSRTSSFYKLSSLEIEQYINTLNAITIKAKSVGFDEVYLSIIPNPVTIVDSGRGTYNNLIPAIQNNPNLKMRVIDIYKPFKKSHLELYSKSDSHWNQDGFYLWLEQFNKQLDNVVSSHKNNPLR